MIPKTPLQKGVSEENVRCEVNMQIRSNLRRIRPSVDYFAFFLEFPQ